LQVRQTIPKIHKMHVNGIGYSSPMWKGSDTLVFLKSLPEEVPIYSNGPDVIYILLGRASERLPVKINPGTKKENINFIKEISIMEARSQTKDGVIVFFDNLTWRRHLPTAQELEKYINIYPIYQGQDGVVYKIKLSLQSAEQGAG